MARIIDESKLARIHAATMKLVVENGYGGASTASIAKKAGVAEGYLYRFYSSKQELVTTLLYGKINKLVTELKEYIVQYPEIKKVIELLINKIFQLAETEPDEIRFIHVLMHDYNFQSSAEQREEIRVLCQKVIEIGVESNVLNKDLSPEEVYVMVILYPIEFINLRIKGFFGGHGWSDPEKEKVVNFCLNSLK
jgi:AcrR family transcriptional regulator